MLALFILSLVVLAVLLYKRHYGSRPNFLGSGFKAIENGNWVKETQRAKKNPTVSIQNASVLDQDRILYHRLLNIAKYPEIACEAHNKLRELLSDTTFQALNEPSSIISALPSYSPEKLSSFLKHRQDVVEHEFRNYISRRNQNGPREMFENIEDAKEWLRNSAPVKFVDGVWLQNAFRINAAPGVRELLWQIMSEELGDGDLRKNHIALYEKLINDISGDLPPAHSVKFISPSMDLSESRVWKAALAQILISLFPESYVPELLGFVLAYESLPYHLLVSIYELKELKLDAYYFVLHVSIDNSDCGHAKMSFDAVCRYMENFANDEGKAIWRRICAGYALAEGLPTTPDLDQNRLEKEMGDMIFRKAEISRGVHAGSRAKIGNKPITEWLDPEVFKCRRTRSKALQNLADAKAWVRKGVPHKSRLFTAMQWGGSMYGAFSSDDADIVERWIRSLGEPTNLPDYDCYQHFVGKQWVPNTNSINLDQVIKRSKDQMYSNYPTIIGNTQVCCSMGSSDVGTTEPALRLLPLLFGSLILLEESLGPPSKSANVAGMAILKILRILHGCGESNGTRGTTLWDIASKAHLLYQGDNSTFANKMDEIFSTCRTGYHSMSHFELLGMIKAIAEHIHRGYLWKTLPSKDQAYLDRFRIMELTVIESLDISHPSDRSSFDRGYDQWRKEIFEAHADLHLNIS